MKEVKYLKTAFVKESEISLDEALGNNHYIFYIFIIILGEFFNAFK